jgi:hypothetical protein
MCFSKLTLSSNVNTFFFTNSVDSFPCKIYLLTLISHSISKILQTILKLELTDLQRDEKVEQNVSAKLSKSLECYVDQTTSTQKEFTVFAFVNKHFL